MLSVGEIKRRARERATLAARGFAADRAKEREGIEAAARRRSAAQTFSRKVRGRHAAMFKKSGSAKRELAEGDREVSEATGLPQQPDGGTRASQEVEGGSPRRVAEDSIAGAATPAKDDEVRTPLTAALSPPDRNVAGTSGPGARRETRGAPSAKELEEKFHALERTVAPYEGRPHPLLPETRVLKEKARRFKEWLANSATTPGRHNGGRGGALTVPPAADGGSETHET